MRKAKTANVKKLKKKEINFYERYYYDPEAEAKKKFFVTAIIPAAALLVVILGIFAFFKISDAIHNHQIKEIQEYLSSPQTTQSYNEAMELQQKRDDLAKVSGSMEGIISTVEGLPDMDTSVIGRINSALSGAKVISHTYDSGAGTFVIVTRTSTAAQMPGLVKRLKSVGCFSDVAYKGYEDSDSKYVATISCVMFR